MTYVKLTHSGTTYLVGCTKVTVGGSTNTFSKSNVSGTAVVEVQTQSFNNPIYNIQGVHFKGDAGYLTYAALLSMYKLKYDGTNPIYLQVSSNTAVSSVDTSLVASDGISTSIPVIMKSFNYPIDTEDSKGGYMPVATISFEETK